MFKYLIFILFTTCFFISCLTAEARDKEYNLWSLKGYLKVNWNMISEKQKAYVLERYRRNIEYSIKNLGKQIKKVDIKKLGTDKGYEYITFGLIAYKYQDEYHNFRKAAEYFYKDWLEWKKSRRGEKSIWFGGFPGDYYQPLAIAIDHWRYAGMYNKALKYYQECFDDLFLNQFLADFKGTKKEKLKILTKRLEMEHEWSEAYNAFMQEWKEAKKLAKTEKPKPLEPAVQNHEWFYSEKEEEVLKALDYYDKHKVKFMIEKAAKRKNKTISAKAKDYLKNWKEEPAKVEGKKKDKTEGKTNGEKESQK